jgi:hypothetical protein
MSEEYIQSDDMMTQSIYELPHNQVLVIIDLTQQPIEIRDGISKLISYAPYCNLVSESAMEDEASEFKWHVKYVCKNERGGE